MSTTSTNNNGPLDPDLLNQQNNVTNPNVNNEVSDRSEPDLDDTIANDTDTESSYNSIEDLTSSLTEDIQNNNVTDEDLIFNSDLTVAETTNTENTTDLKEVDLSETLFSAENIARDQELVTKMGEDLMTISGEDDTMDYLKTEAFKYEFGEDVDMTAFEILEENLDDATGFTFTKYGNGTDELTIFSKYDEEDEHAELGIYRDDDSTTKFDYSALNKTERGVLLQHTTDFYDNDKGEKEREFVLVYNDKYFEGTDRLDNETGLWTTESQKNGNEETDYSAVKLHDGSIMVQAYTADENNLEIQITNDIGTAFMNTSEQVEFTTEGTNFRDGQIDGITEPGQVPIGGMLYINYDGEGNETGYSSDPDADVNQGIYNSLAQNEPDSQVGALQAEYNQLVTEIGHLTSRLYDHNDGDSRILTGAPATVTQVLLSEAMVELIGISAQIAEAGEVAGQ